MNIFKNNTLRFLKVTTTFQSARNLGKIIYKPLIPENYPVVYEKPLKTPSYMPNKSGDLGLKIDVSPDDFILHSEDLKELNEANDIVKKMFTLKYHPRKETVKLMKDKLTKQIQRHKYDTKSEEVKIAMMTLRIKLLHEYIMVNKRDQHQKRTLQEIIDKRNKHLKLLRNIDYKLYEWLLEKLNLFYRLPLEDPHEKVTKKGTIRALTDKLCQQIIQDKLDAYKAELDAEKKIFYKDKLEKFISIREQELALGLLPTITEKEINIAKRDVEKFCYDKIE